MASTFDYNKTRNLINNSVDLTTEEVNSNNKAFVIDKRLLDVLLSKVIKGDLDDLKRDLSTIVAHADSKQDLFNKLDEYLYLDKIVQAVTQSELDADAAKHRDMEQSFAAKAD